MVSAAALAGVMLVGGCARSDPNSVAAQAAAGDQKGYVAGDGSVMTLPGDRRTAPLDLAGPSIDGATWSLTQHRGRVVVVNVWGSWCPPCIEETPAMKAVYTALTSQPVDFVGIDIKESPASARAFVAEHQIPWTSLAYQGGAPLLALHGMAPATPTTLVLDRGGRVAGRVLGPVSTATLVGLVHDILATP